MMRTPNESLDGCDVDLASADRLIESLRQQVNNQAVDIALLRRKVSALEKQARSQEVELLRQRLAAALAACKAKDEALNAIATTGVIREAKWCGMSAKDIAELALAIQPDDSALKSWLGEPVAWLHENRPDADVITHAVKNVWNGVVVGRMAQYSIPLYSTKGMTK